MEPTFRRLGLFDATSIGVGAIVGGGVLALAGAALSSTGPSAALAFGLNGVIAVLTALSFAELATAFPQSGGTYLFAKRVLTVGAAFYVGWIVWFASIVAAALYAIGFASFLVDALAALWTSGVPAFSTRAWITAASIAVTVACTMQLIRRPGSSGGWLNVLKIAVFASLILGGIFACWRDEPPVLPRLQPFFPMGPGGLVTAMGFTFIALQGFDLVAAVAGEVKNPRLVLPRAMLLSLAVALLVYVPLLGLIAVAGAPAQSRLADFVAQNPDTVVARAAHTFVGPAGYWLVMSAGILSMLSALIANLFAAARIAQVMARDRTLPAQLERDDPIRHTPRVAAWATAGVVCLLIVVVGDVSSAGAASSLIFLVSFALAHGICVLARRRRSDNEGFRVPWFPVLPITGGLACLTLAIFQGVAVPAAGAIAVVWLAAGFFAYIWIFERRARILDAATETSDPVLAELRGQSPLVLVPIANPANAGTMVFLGACVAPARVGRVLLLNVAKLDMNPTRREEEIAVSADVLRQSMSAALRVGIQVECLATAAPNPWGEIERVARAHRCTTVLLGIPGLSDPAVRARLEGLADSLPGHIVILRAKQDWQPESVGRVLVPVGGRVVHNELRARLLGGLRGRIGADHRFAYLMVLPTQTPDSMFRRHETRWQQLAREESGGAADLMVVRSDDVATEVVSASDSADLVLVGLQRGHQRVFGSVVTEIVERSDRAVVIVGQRD
jgi:APA family basic amino acid/polyamine antiporter